MDDRYSSSSELDLEDGDQNLYAMVKHQVL